MSNQQFTLEYLVKVTGGSQAASQINGVTKATQMNGVQTIKAAKSQEQLGTASNKAAQKMTGTTRNLRGLTFGLTGLVSSGVEAAGMWGIYQDSQKRVDEATRALSEAIKTYGEDSTQATRATNELNQAERALNMVRRNTILSMFDMVTWITLTVNGIQRLRQGQQLQRTVTDLATAANQRNVVSQQLANASNVTAIGTLQNKTIALGRATVATDGLTAASTRFGRIMSSTWVKVLGPIAIAIGAIVVASKAWKENWGGFGDVINRVGVAIGNIHPSLKGLMEGLAKVGESVNAVIEGRFGDIGKIWSGTAEDISSSNEEITKSIEELNKASAEFVLTLADMDKKERKKELFNLGIKGGAAKMIKGVLDDIQKIQDRVTGFSNAMQTIRQINIWDKLGLKDLDADKMTEKILFTFEGRFDNISEMFKKGSIGKKLFNGLEDTMEDAAKDPGKAPQIIAEYLANHPEIVNYLEQMGFDEEAAFLKTMADEALKDWWKPGNFENKNPVTKSKIDPNQLSEEFRSEFPGTIPQITKKLQTVEQDVILNLKDGNGNHLLLTGVAGGGSNITDIVFDLLDDFFSPGAWHDSISKYFAIVPVAQGILTDIMNQFNIAMNKEPIQNFSQTGSLTFTGAATAAGFLNNFFSPGGWHDAIRNFLAQTPVVGGILSDIYNQLVTGIEQMNNSPAATGFDIVKKAIESLFQTAEGATEIEIPVTPKIIMDDLSGSTNSRFEGAMSPAEAIFKRSLDTPDTPVASVPVEGKIVSVADMEGSEGGALGKTPGQNRGAMIKLTSVPVEGNIVSINSESLLNSFALVKTIVVQGALQMSGELSNIWLGMATNWSMIMNSLIANAASGNSGVQTEMSAMHQAITQLMDDIANNWSEVMNSFINNAESAADGVSDAMDDIVSALEDVKDAAEEAAEAIRDIPDAPGRASGGIISRATGGLMSAAGGRFFTANGDQTIRIGDNPGGRESVAFIPHNNPGPTLEKIARMFGGFGESRVSVNRGSSSVSVGHSGTPIIQVFLDGKQVKGAVVQMLAANQSAMK